MGAVFSQLSIEERRRIERWRYAKVPVREMARVLKHSTKRTKPVMGKIMKAVRDLPHLARKSVTFDRGHRIRQLAASASRDWHSDLVLRPILSVAERNRRERQPLS